MVKLRCYLIKPLGKNTLLGGEKDRLIEFINLLDESFCIACIDKVKSVSCKEALHQRTHCALNVLILNVILGNYTFMEYFEGIIDITVDTIVIKKR